MQPNIPPDNTDSEIVDILDKFEGWYRWQFIDMGEPKKKPSVFIMNRIDAQAAIQALITCACNDDGPCKLHGQQLANWLIAECTAAANEARRETRQVIASRLGVALRRVETARGFEVIEEVFNGLEAALTQTNQEEAAE